MDPFSIVVGVGSLVQMSIQLGKCIKSVYEDAASFEEDLEDLMYEVQVLDSVNKSLEYLHKKDSSICSSEQPELSCREVDVRKNVCSILQDCVRTVKRLQVMIGAITQNKNGQATRKRDVIVKHLRKQAKKGELNKIGLKLSRFRASLSVSLTLLSLNYTQRGSQDTQLLGFQLQRQIASLESRLPLNDIVSLLESLQSATTVASTLRLNQHFDTPKTVSTIYTGRQGYLDSLLQAYNLSYDLSHSSPIQKRFVVFGMGGSGKTQFCCKFASDNKQRFWGIFTVDASSSSNAQQSFIAIAKACGTEPNERAAKSWLSCSDKPWLLLIDSADDINMDIERYFPNGEHGLTLITTRNPSLKMHGTIGQQAFHFEGLNDHEASELLLKAADQCEPWTTETKELAAAITAKLGALPLALVHAGKAIKAKYCDMNSYISYYEQSWQLIRQGQKENDQHEEDPEYMEVYASYEVVFSGLEKSNLGMYRDAVQLLKLFSFFHHENIPVDILVAAIKHPKIELEAEAQEAQTNLEQALESGINSWHLDYWRIRLSNTCRLFSKKQLELQYSTLLPKTLLNAELSPGNDDCICRLRKALHLLTQLSLINQHETFDSYSMHPLVHTWIRERPQMTLEDQAIWCEVAMHTLSRSILLPPLDETVDPHGRLATKLIPHIISLEKFQQKVFEYKGEKRKKIWQASDVPLSSLRALFLMKSAVLCSKRGYFKEAEHNLRTVMRLYNPLLAIHFRVEEIMIAASDCLWEQCRIDEAADLREQAFNSILKRSGLGNPHTLCLMGILAESRWEQGRFSESIELFTKAMVEIKMLSESDPATFQIHEQLGTRLRACSRLEDARKLQHTAVAGFKRCLGESDERTLVAIEELANTYRKLATQDSEPNETLGREYLVAAQKHASLVVEQRKKLLGDNQPRTWRAQGTLCDIKADMGELDEAEKLYNLIVLEAARHLGEEHLEVIHHKNHYARILAQQNRWHEAEATLLDISRPGENYKVSSAGDHRERQDALWGLVLCHQKQGKIDSSLAICKKLLMAIGMIQQGTSQTVASSVFAHMVLGKTIQLWVIKNLNVFDSSTLDALRRFSHTGGLVSLRLTRLCENASIGNVPAAEVRCQEIQDNGCGDDHKTEQVCLQIAMAF